MSYRVRVPKVIRGAISRRCTRTQVVQVFSFLHDGNLHRFRKHVIPDLPGCFRARLVLPDERAQMKHLFTFVVEDHLADGYLLIIGYKHIEKSLN